MSIASLVEVIHLEIALVVDADWDHGVLPESQEHPLEDHCGHQPSPSRSELAPLLRGCKVRAKRTVQIPAPKKKDQRRDALASSSQA